MSCSIECLKFCVYIYSAIQVIFAVINIMYHFFLIVEYLAHIGANVFHICSNSLIVVIGTSGCSGAMNESRCEVKIFTVFQEIFLIIYIICTFASFLHGDSGWGISYLLAALFAIWGVSAGFSLDSAISDNEQREYIHDRNNAVIRVPTPQQNQ